MMARRRKSLRVDRVFPEVGRINLVSGAKTLAEHRKRDALLVELYDTGKLDILRAIKNRHRTINEVFAAQRTGKLGFAVTDVVLKKPLWDAMEEWIPESAAAKATRDRNAVSVRCLKKKSKVLGEHALVSDLAVVNWVAARNRISIGPAGWNHVRRMISRFLTMTLDENKHHPFRLEVMRGFPIVEETERIPDLSPEGFWEIMEHVHEALRPCYVTLVSTGMRPGEYLRCRQFNLMPHTRSIRVPGTKTAASADLVRLDDVAWEWVKDAIPCPVSHGVLHTRWKQACVAAGYPDLRLYDLRHCYAQWMVNEGVPEAVVQQALRHKTPSMTRRYTKQRDQGQSARAIAGVIFNAPNGPAIRPAIDSNAGEETQHDVA